MLRTGLARYEEAHGHTSASVDGSAGGGMDRNRLVEKLALYTANTDIAAWIKTFEDDLVDIGVPSRDYKLILARKITSGPALAIISSLDSAECTYADMKRKLIDGFGSNLTSLGAKLLSEFHNTVRPMTFQNAYLHLKSIIDSINQLTGSKDELLLFIATAIFRASRPYHQRGVIASSRVNSFDDLHTVAQMFATSDSERQARYSSRTQANVLECYKCHKLCHRAVDCRSGSSHSNSHSNSQSYNVSSSSSNNQRSNNNVFYFCRELGHKSPDCPNKTHNKGSDTNSDSNKKLHLKRGRGPYHANLAEVKNITTHIVGIVNGEECPIVADTGAEITIVPGNLVYEGQITYEAVEIKDWQGSTDVLFTAAVEFVVAGKRFTDIVAVAPADTLGRKVLYSVPVDKETATKLILDASPDSAGEGEGQGRDTRSIQTPAQSGAGSVDGSGGAPETPLSPPDTPEEPVACVNAVTRATKKRAKQNLPTQPIIFLRLNLIPSNWNVAGCLRLM